MTSGSELPGHKSCDLQETAALGVLQSVFAVLLVYLSLMEYEENEEGGV